MLLEILLEIIVQLVFEVLAGAVYATARALFAYLVDVDFEGNAGRLAGTPAVKLGWYGVIGAAAGALSVVVHPAPLAWTVTVRLLGLLLMPIISGIALAAWDGALGRSGDGRVRSALWAGVAFGVGYVFVRLVIGLLVR